MSNFYLVPDPASAPIVANGGQSYLTVEHAFQAAKFLAHAKPGAKAAVRAADFEVGGMLFLPKAAKLAGARRGMGTAGCTLDVASWSAAADAVMLEALASRWKVDDVFRRVLRETARQGIRLVHFERSGAKSYWGGGIKEGPTVVGRNRLGEMLEGLRDRHLE